MPELGIRIWFVKGRVESVCYSAPFTFKIAGVWVGAHASQVEQKLGVAASERFESSYNKRGRPSGTCRVWEYNENGLLWLRFDGKDRIELIGR